MSLWVSADDPMFLACKRGDLLLVDKHYKYSSDENLVKATNHETNSDGAVYKYILQFLPTLTMPIGQEPVNLPFSQNIKGCKCNKHVLI